MTEKSFFDPKILSDDELFKKQIELIRRKVMAARTGHLDTASRIDQMIQAIDTERRERIFLDRWSLLPSSPVAIETDPSLQEQPSQDVEDKPAKKSETARPVRKPIRSSVPIKPTEES